MMKRFLYCLSGFFVLDGIVYPLATFGQNVIPAVRPVPQGVSRFGILYDQDYTLEMAHIDLNEDRNYTMGVGLFMSYPALKRSFLFKPLYLLNGLIRKQDLTRNNEYIENMILLGNGSFTPDSLHASTVIDNDRPYGSITYLQFRTSYVDGRQKWSSFLNIGLYGSYLARELQSSIHKSMNAGDTRDPRTPKGWKNQISTNGEPTLLYGGDVERLLTRRFHDHQTTQVWGEDLKHGVRYAVGYYTYAGYTFNARFGLIDPRQWTYATDATGGGNKLVGGEEAPRSEYYLFASIRPTFMLYNGLMNGQFRKSPHTLSFGDMRHALLEFDAGISLAPVFNRSWSTRFNVKFSGRSPEFALPGRKPRWHYWGGIDLILSVF